MEEIFLILSLYILLGYKKIYLNIPLGLTILVVTLFLFRKKNKAPLYILISILLFLVISKGVLCTEFTSPIEKENIYSFTGKVVTEPVRKSTRKLGYNIIIDSSGDKNGNTFSSQGKVYVISSLSDVTRGDRVLLYGAMSEDESYFFSEGTKVLKRNSFGALRRKVISKLLSSLKNDNSGNIVSLLLTGSSLDGTKDIQNKASSLGLSYILALSGMHLGFLSLIFTLLFKKILGKKKTKVVVFIFLFFFVYINGWKPSLARALIFLVLLSFLEQGKAFLFSEIFIFMIFPEYVGEVSLTLGFTSLGGILLFSSYVVDTIELFFPHLKKMVSVFSASLSAVVISTPIVVSVFSSWQPLSILFSIPSYLIIIILFVLSLLSIIIKPINNLLDWVISLILKLPEIEMSSSLFPWYYVFLSVLVILVLFSIIYRNRDKMKQYVKKVIPYLKFIFHA